MPPPALHGCAQLYQLGAVVALGQTHEGVYAIWNAAGGPPLAYYPEEFGGWPKAVDHFQHWERAAMPPPPRARNGAGWASLIIFVVILAIVYYAVHEHKYQNCLITPDLFQWPSSCI